MHVLVQYCSTLEFNVFQKPKLFSFSLVLLHHTLAPNGRADARKAGVILTVLAEVTQRRQSEILEVAVSERGR